MGPNFLKNIEGGEIIKDRGGRLRNMLAIFLLVVVCGGFFIQKYSLADKSSLKIKTFIEPFSQVEDFINNYGGYVQVQPPVQVVIKFPELIAEELYNPDKLTANSVLVKDQETGLVLYGKNEYQSWPIASITKLMSALIILEKNPDWSATTTVIGQDSLDTHMYAGDIYTLEELWNSALIASSNKAILTLANALGWPELAFVERMNEKARELGLINTFFADPSGLDSANISMASDVAILLNEALKQEKIQETLKKVEYNLYSEQRKKTHHMWNTNWLLLNWINHNFNEISGGKTGYINASGYNFTMRVANEVGNILDVVILGATNHEARFTEARDIARWCFDNYVWPVKEN